MSRHPEASKSGAVGLLTLSLFPLFFAGFVAYTRMKSPEAAFELPVTFCLLLLAGGAGAIFRRRAHNDPVSGGAPGWRGTATILVAVAMAAWSFESLRPTLGVVVATLAVGIALGLIRPSLGRAWRTPVVLAGATAAAGLVYALYWEAEPLIQTWRIPAPLALAAGSLLGFHTYVTDGALAFASSDHTTLLGSGPRHAELFPALLAITLLGVQALSRRTRGLSGLGRFVVILAASEIWREVVVLGKMAFLTTGDTTPLDPVNQIVLYGLAWLPLLLGGGWWLTRNPEPDARQVVRRPLPRLAAAAVIAGLVLVTAGLRFELPGEPKEGRIAVDAIHSQWEWTDVPVDRYVFGSKTTYNYWSLMVLLRQHFSTVDSVSEGSLTDETLAEYDVWILKTPTQAYSQSEQQALLRFVERGGGLWLIGDHTNIFGMNTFLNDIAERFGMSFNPDAAFDMFRKRDGQMWFRSERNHPVVRDMDAFLFATSDTITIDPLRATPVMVGDMLYSDHADYSKLTFFGDHDQKGDEAYGRFVQCAAARYGKGRVVAFGDSTVFSTFYAHVRGKPELAVGTINWLNHRDPGPWWPVAPLALGALITLAGAGMAARSAGVKGLASALRPALVGVALGAAIAQGLDASFREEVPSPTWSAPRVAFTCGGPTALELRKPGGHDETDPHSFMTFYVGFQRSGVFPFTLLEPDGISDYPMAVFVEPDEAQVARIAELLPSYLARGGRAWILTDEAHDLLTITEACGLDVVATEVPDAEIPAIEEAACTHGDAGDPAAAGTCADGKPCHPEPGLAAEATEVDPRTSLRDALHHRLLMGPEVEVVLSGVTPVVTLEDDEGACVHGFADVGVGRLYITSLPSLFSNAEIGATTDIPTEYRYRILQLLWHTLDDCLERGEKDCFQAYGAPDTARQDAEAAPSPK